MILGEGRYIIELEGSHLRANHIRLRQKIMNRKNIIPPQSKGQSLVEFALVLPILLLLLLGIIEAGRLFFIYNAVTTASREAARYGSTVGETIPGVPNYVHCDGIRNTAVRAGNIAGLDPTNVLIEYDGGFDDAGFNPSAPTSTPYGNCPVAEQNVQLGDRIVVEVSANYQPLIPLINWPGFPVRSITARSIFKEILISTAIVPATNTPTVTPTPSPSTTIQPTATSTGTTTATPTKTPTPRCDLIGAEILRVTGGDDLYLRIRNDNVAPVYLTASTLRWEDYWNSYGTTMYVDWFRLGSTYYNGNSFSSPTTFDPGLPGVELPGNSTVDWRTDFDGIPNYYGTTRFVGPAELDLVFDADLTSCPISGSISEVRVDIKEPGDKDDIKKQSDSQFRAEAWDKGHPDANDDGAGIDRVNFIILDNAGNVILNRNESTAGYCVFGGDDPCNEMDDSLWNTLPNGDYTLIAQARSGVTGAWSELDAARFTLKRDLPKVTNTPAPTFTPFPTAGISPTPDLACDFSTQIESNFNGTDIPYPRYIWFNSHLTGVDGLDKSKQTTLYISNQRIVFTGESVDGKTSTPYNLAVPDAKIVFNDPGVSAPVTSFAGGMWVTRLPVGWGDSGNPFIAGLAFPVPTGGIGGGINPVTWSADYASADGSITDASWQWSAAVYTTFTTNYNALGVEAVDDSKKSGSPMNYIDYVVGGARGGGGSNTTGSNSSTKGGGPCVPAPTAVATSTSTKVPTPLPSATPIPSNTAPPTSTTRPMTPTQTPTRTQTPTVTQTRTPLPPTSTPTVTPTRTQTPIPSATSVPSMTPTISPTPSKTPVPSATPICPVYGTTLQTTGNRLSWNLQNNSADTYTIQSIFITWADDATQDLIRAELDGNVNWTGTEAVPPTTLGSSVLSGNLSIPAFSTELQQFIFQKALPNTGHFISVTFDNGCTVSGSK